MKSIALFLALSISLELIGCKNIPDKKKSPCIIEIENPISVPRKNETISLYSAFIKKNIPDNEVKFIQIKDLKNNRILTTQSIDYDKDGFTDEYIFQSDFGPNEIKKFKITSIQKDSSSKSKVYAAYMPSEEGMEDFTWENDFIGYRFYGQERAKKQGTGIAMDIWCKRTPDFLTDKWYTPSQNYHEDKGYGADHYKSGKNQGCGGTGIFKNDSIYFSKAFSKWKIIANGPIRTVFELQFTGWDLNNTIIETKRITLDAGHYFNKIQSSYNSDITLLGYAHAIGFVQREDSDSEIAKDLSWLACWESLGQDNGNLGTGFITTPTDNFKIEKTNNHIISLMHPKPEIGVSYYTGASWDEFGQIHSKSEWFTFVKKKALLINNPCIVSIAEQR